jgi:histidinol-phosphate phosphatase family protein
MVSGVTKAMILAAGEGTRLRPLTLETPKVLLPVRGVPLICHTLTWLKGHGISQVGVNLYHLGEKIRDFLSDASDSGMEITYSEEEELLGTAGGVKRMADGFRETFVVVYGDVLTNLDLTAMVSFHARAGAIATIAVQELEDATGKGVVRLDEGGRVCSFVEKPTLGASTRALTSVGVYVLEPEILEHIQPGCSDFGIDVFPALLERGVPVHGWALRPWEHLIDIGTPEAYQQANEDMARGISVLRRAVFLDRDGTIAEDVNYCRRPDDFRMFPWAAEAIAMLNKAGLAVVVVTNQSGVARGYFNDETLARIHQRMKDDLAGCGAWVDAIYYCPHHPDDGCRCRKPRTGLFHQAAEELELALVGSYAIGDREMDVLAGQALGCQTVLVGTGPAPWTSDGVRPDHRAVTLYEAAQWILSREES